MPFYLDANIQVRGHRYRVTGYIGDFVRTQFGILVCGHNILKGDIVSGPTYTVKANLKDYINFRGIEMDSFNRKHSTADDVEYRTVAAGLRERMQHKLAHLPERDRIQLIQYYDMQVVIEENAADRIKRINSHSVRVVSSQKQILSVMRASEHGIRSRKTRPS